MKDVADRAGVGLSSVSRVLSGHPDVSPEMRASVMAAVDALGYRPDLLAQGLRSRKTFSVGFTVSDIGNPVLAGIVTGAEKRLRFAGYSLLLTNSEGDPELDADHIRLLGQRRVDGFILSLADEYHPATAAVLRELEVPVVLVDREAPLGIEAKRVCFDHFAGMAAATRHLVGLGHRELALITGGPRRPAMERRRGAVETLHELAPSGHCAVHDGPFSVEHGASAMRAILSQNRRPTAVIAAGNLLMQGALQALHEEDVAVGSDMSFVGCDDVAVADLHQPQIAVVRRDTQAIGTAAAELLLSELEGDGSSDQLEAMLPTEFVARPSCCAPPRN